MSDTPEFIIGREVLCGEEVCGHLSRVLIDPVTDDLTHLVVQPGHAHGHERMVPIDLVDSAADRIRLRCDRAGFERLEELEEKLFLPGDARSGYDEGQTLHWPFYGQAAGALTMGVGDFEQGTPPAAGGEPAHFITQDQVPEGEVELRRGDRVHASDGAIGHVHGFVVDPDDHHVTHILLEAGHLWGRRDITIPITAVADVEDGVRLKLTRDQVRDLPTADFEHRG